MICDNLSAYMAPVVHAWLLAHPRFTLHFTPTYFSWLNQVERWFAELQRRCLEHGVFCSLDALTTTLEDWIEVCNDNARPFKWTKTADQIIDRICRYCDRISDRLTSRGLPGGAVSGRKGQCWDNALAESFFASLKGELTDNQAWPTRAAVRRAIVEYIGWCNGTRLHSTLGYLSPAEFEASAGKQELSQVA